MARRITLERGPGTWQMEIEKKHSTPALFFALFIIFFYFRFCAQRKLSPVCDCSRRPRFFPFFFTCRTPLEIFTAQILCVIVLLSRVRARPMIWKMRKSRFWTFANERARAQWMENNIIPSWNWPVCCRVIRDLYGAYPCGDNYWVTIILRQVIGFFSWETRYREQSKVLGFNFQISLNTSVYRSAGYDNTTFYDYMHFHRSCIHI